MVCRAVPVSVRWRDQGLDPDALLAQRRERSKPLWDERVLWCTVRKKHEPPASKARRRPSLLHQPPGRARALPLLRVRADGQRLVERLHVRTALTRKNYLLPAPTRASSAPLSRYTILGSCRLAGVDPLEYLRDVRPTMRRKIRLVDLADLPHRCKQCRDAVAAFCAALARLGRCEYSRQRASHGDWGAIKS